MKIEKKIWKKLSIFMLFVMTLSYFCCANPHAVSAKARWKVMSTKQGITYTKSTHIKTYERGIIEISNYGRKVKSVKSDSKFLKAKEFFGTIDIQACKSGTYHVTYEVKEKKKTVKLQTTVYVTDDILPFKSITIGGKKLTKVKGGYWSTIRNTYSDDGFYETIPQFYYSPQYKGKMKITPKPGYKIKSILISEDEPNSSKADLERYSSGGFENEEVDNGEYVRLNHIASGTLTGYDDEISAGNKEVNRYRDEYKYKTAYTHVSICYWDKYLKANAWMEIVICVDATK